MSVLNHISLGTELVGVNRVRSVVVTKYDINERVMKGWFSDKKCYEEAKRGAEKQIYEDGRIKERSGSFLHFDLSYFNCKMLYEYRNGLEIGCRGYDNNGNIIYEKKSEYYPNDKLKRTEEFITLLPKKGRENSIETYVRDSHGNQIEYSIIHEGYKINEAGNRVPLKSTWIEKSNWIYGDNISREIWEVESIDCNGRRCYRKERRYERNGRKVMEIEYGEKGNVVHTWEYMYDKQGRDYKRLADGHCVDEWRYNEHRDVVWHKSLPYFLYDTYDWEKERKYKERVVTHEYHYDDKGNWIENKEIWDGKYMFLTTREIEYLY